MKRDLPQVEKAIRTINANLADPETAFANAARIVSKEGFGTLLLSREEVRVYNEALEELLSVYGRDKQLSRPAADTALRDAVIEAVGEQDQEVSQFEKRLESALFALRTTLLTPPNEFTCFVELGGAGAEGLPFQFGNVRIVRFTDAQLRKFRSATRHHRVQSTERARRAAAVRSIRESSIWNSPCAEVRVIAKDASAAEELAERETRRNIDALNFFADLVPYHHGCLFLPGDSERTNRTVPILSSDKSWKLSQSRVGPVGPFEFMKVRRATRIQRWVSHAHRLLASNQPSSLETILLTALQWAGRATAAFRRDQAFLSYAIALESAVLPTPDPQELSYRLRTRISFLVGGDKSKRRSTSKQVRDLYRTRSQIVHNGSYEIAETELKSMRILCKTALLKLLVNRTVRQFRTPGELEEWFNDHAMA